MRVTDSMMMNTAISNLNRINERLAKANEMVTSQKRINKPSDDPVGMAKSLDIRRTLSLIGQYQDNIANGQMRISTTDQTLDLVQQFIQSAKAIAQGSHPANYPVAANQVRDIRDQIIQLMNTQLGGEYIFSGFSTDSPPFDTTGVYSGTYGSNVNLSVGPETLVKVNASGDEVFEINGDQSLLISDLDDLITALQTNDSATVGTLTDNLDAANDRIEDFRSEAAGRGYRLEAMDNHWKDFAPRLEQLLSDTEDADITRAVTELKALETAYETTLAATARIYDTSLIDFLR